MLYFIYTPFSSLLCSFIYVLIPSEISEILWDKKTIFCTSFFRASTPRVFVRLGFQLMLIDTPASPTKHFPCTQAAATFSPVRRTRDPISVKSRGRLSGGCLFPSRIIRHASKKKLAEFLEFTANRQTDEREEMSTMPLRRHIRERQM